MIHIKITTTGNDEHIQIHVHDAKNMKSTIGQLVKIPSFKRSGMNKFRELLQIISYETTLLLKEIEK